MTHRRWSRRAVTVAIAGAMSWISGRANAQSVDHALEDILLGFFLDPNHACAIGQLCLRNLPSGHSPEPIATLLLAANRNGATPEAIRQHVANMIASDFENGHVVVVDGWHLSLTEARLYALVARIFPAAV